LHELKLIVDMMYEGGLSWMRYSISDTAEYGDYTRGPRVINTEVRAEMRRILDEIQDGTFAKEWIAEADGGFTTFLRLRDQARTSQLEDVGRGLRQMMPWLESETKVVPT
jgi:ketol-acid reductoisomerase